MRALVTGATGFIGLSVTKELLARGWEVRILYRESSDLSLIDELESPVDRALGDLRDLDSLRRAIDGCDTVFHVAARYEFGLRGWRDLVLDNQVGTANVLRAAKEHKTSKIVYTSTVGVLKARRDGSAVGEDEMAEFSDMSGPYKRSKWLAEREVQRAVQEGVPVVSVCPTAPVGPGDAKPTPTGRMILEFLLGRMPAYVETGLNLVSVEDVAVGHVLAAERGVVGEPYILGGEDWRLLDILRALSEFSGRPVPRLRIPKSCLLPMAYTVEGIAWLLRRESPRLTIENAKMSQTFMYFDSGKACRELGYAPGSARDALERAVAWYRGRGYAPNLAPT